MPIRIDGDVLLPYAVTFVVGICLFPVLKWLRKYLSKKLENFKRNLAKDIFNQMNYTEQRLQDRTQLSDNFNQVQKVLWGILKGQDLDKMDPDRKIHAKCWMRRQWPLEFQWTYPNKEKLPGSAEELKLWTRFPAGDRAASGPFGHAPGQVPWDFYENSLEEMNEGK